MTKTIDTIVEDIYNIFECDEEVKVSKEDLDELAKGILDAVTGSLKERERSKGHLRLSLIGHPDRKIWYTVRDGDKIGKEKLKGQDKIKFLYGHILECLLIFLSRTAGHTVTDEQKTVTVNGVVGHQDAVVDNVLVDFKSASSYGFKKFKENTIHSDDPFGYIAQISAYAQANNLDKAGFVVIDKSSGELCYCPVHSMEMINAEERIESLRRTVKSDVPPPRCYSDIPDGKSGNHKLHIGCVYCSFKHVCWSDANGGAGLKKFNYSTGPRYLTRVDRTPNVEEIHEEI
tara:strand:+ start:5961 stop:6824 length:864 start_codon:yes stop_codon:yes gene_type:complete